MQHVRTKSEKEQVKAGPLKVPIFSEAREPAATRSESPEIMHQIRRNILRKLARQMDREMLRPGTENK